MKLDQWMGHMPGNPLSKFQHVSRSGRWQTELELDLVWFRFNGFVDLLLDTGQVWDAVGVGPK